MLSATELQDLGFAIAIFPATGFLAAARALNDAYGALLDDGITTAVKDRLYPFEAMNELMGFEEVWEFDKTYGE